MFFTPEQLSSDPELRPVVWHSEKAYQSERHHLLTQLASCLHSQSTSPATGTSNLTSNTYSSNSYSSDTKPITTIKSKKSASTLLGSRRLASPFLPSSATPTTPKFKPVTFTSPQTSIFRFDAAAQVQHASPWRVDSVMGSPIRFLNPAIFKRKNKVISAAGKMTGHFAAVKEAEIFNCFKNVGEFERCDDKEGKSDNGKIGKEGEDGEEENIVKNDIDDKGVRYVEYLGLAAAAEPQSIEYQYRFVKAQLQKSRDTGLKAEDGQEPS